MVLGEWLCLEGLFGLVEVVGCIVETSESGLVVDRHLFEEVLFGRVKLDVGQLFFEEFRADLVVVQQMQQHLEVVLITMFPQVQDQSQQEGCIVKLETKAAGLNGRA